MDSVSDEEIVEGISLLAQTTGIFTETAGGVTTAVLAKLAERGDIDPSERVVLVITGEGLKTLEAARGTFETVRDRAHGRGVRDARRRARSAPRVLNTMAVTVKLPAQLRDSAGGASEAQVEGETVGEVLESLFASHPALRERIADGDGRAALRERLSERRGHPFPRRHETPVSDGAELTILPAVAGG